MKDKKDKLLMAIDKINKSYGANTVVTLNDAPLELEAIPTGSISLDIATGVGGYPRGRIVEIYGEESAGKTTLTIHAIAECQKLGGKVAFIDAEQSFNKEYAETLGVNTSDLLISQPSCGEEALEVTQILIDSGDIDLIIIDSVAALTPRSEIDGEMGDSSIGVHARLMSKAMRKLAEPIKRTNTCCIFINQLRTKIGVMYANPNITTGGNALKFYASIRLDIRKSKKIEGECGTIGNRAIVNVVKNKVAPPFRKAEFDVIYGKGISQIGELLDYALRLNIITKAGAWFKFEDVQLGQGRLNTIALLEDNEELVDQIQSMICKP